MCEDVAITLKCSKKVIKIEMRLQKIVRELIFYLLSDDVARWNELRV
jgi:hypothetical protein